MADRPRILTDDEIREQAGATEDALDFIDTENNEGELAIALENIKRSMERGWSYERAVQQWGIRGHPYFKDFWTPTRYWGDARWARKELGLPLE